MTLARATTRCRWRTCARSRASTASPAYDPELRKIEFHNPAAADPTSTARAVFRADGTWTSENWDGRTKVEFCRDGRARTSLR